MGKLLAGNDGPTLGITSSLDMFNKLKYESRLLDNDLQNTYNAFNFIVTAWHLFNDWPKCEDKLNISRIKRQKKQIPLEILLVLNAVRDLCNGSKHFTLEEKAANNIVINEVLTGNEIGPYEYFFHETTPAVKTKDGFYFPIRVLNNIVMSYFEWVFDDSIPASKFPPEIIDAIKFCNIAKRTGSPPEIWSREPKKQQG